MKLELRQARLSDAVVAPLLAGLEQEYETRYGGNDEMSWTRPEEFDPPGGLFLVLLDGPVTAAGGGYRQHDAGSDRRVCEVKRMWTNPDYRREGLAARVLDALEREAFSAGYHRLVLETGPAQPEAAALYEQRGYVRIPRYGRYAQALAFAMDLHS
ncbi:MAG: GNAT family N-acetyltransferase [Acidimicrobiales bacterium]|nr:GNAT family N-acetyltransferase [Acidimicrobiales bacterium]